MPLASPRSILQSLLLAACAWSIPVHAAPLVFAFEEMLPWKTVSGNQYGGAYTEIVRELARRVELPLEMRNCPLKRCLYWLEKGDADILIGVRDTPERQRYLQFLRTPYREHSSDKVFYVLKNKGLSIRSYAGLEPLRIGITPGARYFERFDNDHALTKDEGGTMEINFRKLVLGRLDAVVAPEDQGEAQVTRLGLGDVVEKAPYRESDASPRAIALSKKSVHIARLEQFERAMAAMARDGTLAAIIRRHYHEAYRIAPDAMPIR
ncbi:MAG: transporter substrate-binding domain-containing protein [Pseudomonadota bacterium]